jgi:hypothetical protein
MRKILLTPLLVIAFVATYAQDPILSVPGNYGQTYFSYSLSENILYAAPERFRVTSTVQGSNVGLLFDQDYNRQAITVSAGNSTTITIDLKGKNGYSLTNSEGYIYLNFYDENHPDSIYTRLYDSTGDFADFEWDEWSNASTTSPYLLYRLHIPDWLTNRSKIELKIFAHAATPLILTEIEYYLQSPGQFEKGLVNKFANNTLWHDMSWRDTGSVQRAYIKANGNGYLAKLGIGTTNINDTFKLFVEGAIRARKLQIDQDSWPDYVFSKNYRLQSLGSLAAYIKANNHLPDVPSAKEIKVKGLDVAANQAILMQKIEELTLYLIEQNKTIQQQQRQIDQLKKQFMPARNIQ